jgi:hypothetical protein
VATVVGWRDQPALKVTIHDAMPYAEGDVPNPIGERYWFVSPRVTVDPHCPGLRVSSSSRRLYNGVSVGSGGEDPLAGETVRITARAVCRDGTRGLATRDIQIPPVSCDAGPLRIYDLRGQATIWDWNHEDRRMEVHEGDLIAPGSPIRVSRGGRVEVGAPECNGLRVLLFEGEGTVGGYDAQGRGAYFSGSRIVARGDTHAGGFFVEGARPQATVRPLGRVARYEVRSGQRRVTVRVYDGAVLVSGTNQRKWIRVQADRQTSVLCSTPRRCMPTRPRIFQPSEPWTTTPNAHLRDLPRHVAGADPPLSALLPQFAKGTARHLAATRGEPAQIVVDWSRDVRRPGRAQELEQGFIVWQRDASGWHVAYRHRYPYGLSRELDFGDVTGDGHGDILVTEAQGTAYCGPRMILGTVGAKAEQLFRRYLCEGHAAIENGALVFSVPVGPCPYRQGSAHCFGGWRRVVMRWHGRQLVSSKSSIRCNLPRLAPATRCSRAR